jgi:transposase-like protein
LRFPAWKALRATNALERIHEDCRRCAKTQSCLPTSHAVLLLLFGRLRSGAVKLRALDGRKDMPKADQEAA